MDDIKRKYFAWAAICFIVLGGFVGGGVSAGQAGVIARPQMDLKIPETTEIALFAFG